MKISIMPTFEKGPEIYCGVVSVLTQLRGSQSLHEAIFCPISPIPRMLSLQGRAIEQLDGSDADASRIKKIWSLYKEGMGPAKLTSFQSQVEKWVQDHQTGHELPARFSEIFDRTGIVVSETVGPPNAILPSEVESLIQVFDEFIGRLKIEEDDSFKNYVHELIAKLIAYKKGLALVKAVSVQLQTQNKSIVINSDLRNGIDIPQLELSLSQQSFSGIYETEDGLRSYLMQREISLGHELIHALRFLEGRLSDSLQNELFRNLNSEAGWFCKHEEYATIEEDPLSENAIAAERNLPKRHSHYTGIDPRPAPNIKAHLRHAILRQLSGDFPWILGLWDTDPMANSTQALVSSFLFEKLSPSDYTVLKKFIKHLFMHGSSAFPQRDAVIDISSKSSDVFKGELIVCYLESMVKELKKRNYDLKQITIPERVGAKKRTHKKKEQCSLCSSIASLVQKIFPTRVAKEGKNL